LSPAVLSVSGQPPASLRQARQRHSPRSVAFIFLLGSIGSLMGAATGGVVGVIEGASLSSPPSASACEAAVNDGALVLIVQAHPGDPVCIRELLGKHLLAEQYV